MQSDPLNGPPRSAPSASDLFTGQIDDLTRAREIRADCAHHTDEQVIAALETIRDRSPNPAERQTAREWLRLFERKGAA